VTGPRPETLAALGLVRWRLRGRARAAAPPGAPAPAAAAIATAGPADTAAIAPLPEPARQPGCAPALLRLHAPGLAAAPLDGGAAVIWRQLLAWLALPADAIAFAAAPGPGVVELPAPAQWQGVAGKRDLWLALKAHAAPVAPGA